MDLSPTFRVVVLIGLLLDWPIGQLYWITTLHLCSTCLNNNSRQMPSSTSCRTVPLIICQWQRGSFLDGWFYLRLSGVDRQWSQWLKQDVELTAQMGTWCGIFFLLVFMTLKYGRPPCGTYVFSGGQSSRISTRFLFLTRSIFLISSHFEFTATHA